MEQSLDVRWRVLRRPVRWMISRSSASANDSRKGPVQQYGMDAGRLHPRTARSFTTGAYTDRETDQIVDYSDYLFVGQYLPYYICDGSGHLPGRLRRAGTCQAPNLFVDSSTQTESDDAMRFRLTYGRRRSPFASLSVPSISDLELTERNDFTYPGSVQRHRRSTGFLPASRQTSR